MLTFEQITARLNEFHPTQDVSAFSEALYADVSFLPTSDLSKKEIIYVGTAAEFTEKMDKYKDCGLLLIEDGSRLPELSGNITFFPEDTDIIELYNTAQRLFDASKTLARQSSMMLTQLTSGKTIEDIITTASKLLENPVLLPDSSGRLIAVSSQSEISDPASWDLITQGYVTGNFIRKFQTGRMDLKITESLEPIKFDTGPFKDTPRIVHKIKVRKRTVAYLMVLETDRPFREEDFETVRMVCKVLSLMMSMNQSFSNYTGEVHEHRMIDLLTENETGEPFMSSKERWTLTGDYTVAAISSPHDNPDTYLYFEYLRMRIKNILPRCKSVFYDYHLVLLLSTSDSTKLAQYKATLETLLLEEGIAAGLSRHFSNITDLKKHYTQAVQSIYLGRLLSHTRTLFEYAEYEIYHMLHITSSKTDLKEFCHPSLEILLEHDRLNGTDYFRTLHEYLKNATNKMQTAGKLYIHRNTMDHRIRKIAGLTGMDLTDGEDCFMLFLSYKILELVKG